MTWKPDKKEGLKVVLDTRDNEDSSTMFRFPVSTHKKSDALLKKLVRNLDQFGGSLGLKPLCAAVLLSLEHCKAGRVLNMFK